MKSTPALPTPRMRRDDDDDDDVGTESEDDDAEDVDVRRERGARARDGDARDVVGREISARGGSVTLEARMVMTRPGVGTASARLSDFFYASSMTVL